MNYALFYAIMQHMYMWGYRLKDTVQPCLVVEYIENVINDLNSYDAGAFINLDMDRFMSNGLPLNQTTELIVHPILEDLFVKDLT